MVIDEDRANEISEKMQMKYKIKGSYKEKVMGKCYHLETSNAAMIRFLENQVAERKKMKNIDYITTDD